MSESDFATTSCSHCGQHIKFPIEGMGVKIACPNCALETVLLQENHTLRESEEITAAELKAALEGVIPRRRVSVVYQAGLLLVALFMILLPVAYLGFAALAAYGICWYAVHARAVLLSSLSGGLYVLIFRLLLYLGPLIGGGIAVFFMFKPLLARIPKPAEPIELNPAQHPRLYQVIAHVSDALCVQMPRTIRLTCELNASVGFRRGWQSLLGNDLVLNLGLPLVAGLNTRQLAAVVAHELGHCTQALATRMTYIIDRIDGWFMRVVYGRDAWDEAFEEWADSVRDLRLSLIVGCARLAVWFSRRVLALLMFIGHAASCLLSRQMEFHADACATAVVGATGLESLLIRLREQSIIERLAYDALGKIWQKRHQLPDNLPEFLQQLESRCKEDFYEQVRLTLLNERTGLFSTHPTAAQRIRKARQRGEVGIFQLEKPARFLLKDFDGVSKVVTGRYYRQNLRLAVLPSMLKPTGEFFEGGQAAPARPRFVVKGQPS